MQFQNKTISLLCAAIAFIALMVPMAIQAQNVEESKNNSGSFYSLFGIGYPTDVTNARERGLGITGLSLANSESNSLSNPALWSSNMFSTASSGFGLAQYQSKDPVSQSTNSMLDVSNFQLTLPVYREKLGVSIALYSVTRANYRYFSTDSTEMPNGEFVNYGADLTGSGGLNKLEIGFGWAINRNLSIGYAPSFAFLSQNNAEDVYFDRTEFSSSSQDQQISGHTFAHRVGLLGRFRNILSDNDRISIGATFNFPINIDAEEEVTAVKVVDDIEQEVTVKEPSTSTITIPAEIGAGATYYPSNQFNISVEGLYQQWSEFEAGEVNTHEAAMLSDRHRLGLGLEYHPYRGSSTSFFSNFRYSLGSSYDSGHLKIDNTDINTFWLNAGLGILSPTSRSSVDLSLRYGLRGTTSNSLIREKIWSLNLSVNLTELMFFRPKLN